jgi:membrane protease YdiL (CAAX protease family)
MLTGSFSGGHDVNMQSIGSKEILLIFLSLFVIFLVAAMFAAEGWVIVRLFSGRRVLPAAPLVRRREVPWGIGTILLVVGIYLVVNLGAFLGYAKMTGRIPSRLERLPTAAPGAVPKGPNQSATPDAKAEHVALDPGKEKPKPSSKSDAPADKDHHPATPGKTPAPAEPDISMTEKLALQAVINVILLIMVSFILGMTSQTPLRDLGLQFDRWWLQAAVGVVSFLAIQPVVLAIQFVATLLWENNTHPLYKMISDEFSPGVAQLAILMAVIVAPVFEELLFRGIIQSWLVSLGTRRGHEPAKLVVELADTGEDPEFMPSAAWDTAPAQSIPAAKVVLDPPATSVASPEVNNPYASHSTDMGLTKSGPPLNPSKSDLPTPPTSGLAGIVATSLIFAALHGPQWPAPIALFVLSVVIGYVYHRTGSLLAAICMHAAFNGFSTLLLLGYLLAPQSTHDARKAAKPAVSAVTIMADHGSAWMTGEK